MKIQKPYPSNKPLPWRRFFDFESVGGEFRARTFAYRSPSVAETAESFVDSDGNSFRYPKGSPLYMRRLKALQRALRRGRATQAANVLIVLRHGRPKAVG